VRPEIMPVRRTARISMRVGVSRRGREIADRAIVARRTAAPPGAEGDVEDGNVVGLAERIDLRLERCRLVLVVAEARRIGIVLLVPALDSHEIIAARLQHLRHAGELGRVDAGRPFADKGIELRARSRCHLRPPGEVIVAAGRIAQRLDLAEIVDVGDDLAEVLIPQFLEVDMGIDAESVQYPYRLPEMGVSEPQPGRY